MRSLLSKPNVDAADSDYIFGKIRDKSSTLNGTPVNEEVYGDVHQFFEKLMFDAGVTPNDLPEGEYVGFQQNEALDIFVKENCTIYDSTIVFAFGGQFTIRFTRVGNVVTAYTVDTSDSGPGTTPASVPSWAVPAQRFGLSLLTWNFASQGNISFNSDATITVSANLPGGHEFNVSYQGVDL